MTAPSGRADDLTWRTRALGAVAGVLAAAVAMGAAQFASGLGVPQSSPVFAVGQAAIDLTPAKVKDFAIAAFGANDKTVLLGGILVVLAASAAVAGMLAVRRLASGVCALAILASIGLAAALTRPTATAGYVVPTLVGAAAGTFALTWLVGAAVRLGSPLDALFPSDLLPELTDLAQPASPPPRGPRRPRQAWPIRPAQPPHMAARPRPRRRTDRPCGPGLLLHRPGSSGRPGAIPLARAAAVPVHGRGGGGHRRARDAGRGRNLAHEHNIATARTDIRFPRPCDAGAPPLPAWATTWACPASARSSPRTGVSTGSTPPSRAPGRPGELAAAHPRDGRREMTLTFADLRRAR